VGEVVDNCGDETWKPGDKVAATMGNVGEAFDGMHPAPRAQMAAKVNVDNIFGEGGYVEVVSMPKASVSKRVTFPSNFGWTDFGGIPETSVTCM